MKQSLLCILFALACSLAQAQQSITGKIKNKTTDSAIVKVSVSIKGSSIGTVTDETGSFQLDAPSLPATLVISHMGFISQEITVHTRVAPLILLETRYDLLAPVVIAPTRTRGKSLFAPVSLEQISARQIMYNPSPDYYGLAGIKKGVDQTTSSMTFKTMSTRGFNGSGSSRVNQIVEGMDNQAPGLNFAVGNFAGLTELDVDNIEILPGASSALYGPGGMNGTILINSKSPFKYEGLSILVKEGVNNIDKSQRSGITPFHDFSLRWAKSFHDKFAFKVGVQYISATDWLAHDSSNYSRAGTIGKVIPGNRKTDPNYDGVNVYGDETTVDIYPFLYALTGDANQPHINVSRTGYDEKDVIDPKTKNVKLSGALHYKLNKNLEAQLMGYWATGNTVYTGNNRYALKGIKLGQYKFELKHRDWFLRSYTTQENAGQAYSATVTTQLLNEAWKRSYDPSNPAASWYPQYAGAYLQAKLQGADDATANNIARSFADQGRPLPGSDNFKQIFDQVRKTPIPNGGLFLEKSQLWMTEGQYNFSNKIKFAEIIVGANLKKYILDSKGTLFIDTLKPIGINEIGAYAQATKKFFNNKLSLSASGRYDKNEDFKGQFTPRVTALITVAKNQNIRLSYQTAYRFPTTQQKYIRLNVGDYMLLGGLPWVMDYMHAEKNPVFEIGPDGKPSSTPYTYKEFKPENMQSFEIGYKGLIGEKLLIDMYAYAGHYENFLGRNALYQPSTNQVFSTVVNSSTKVKTHGFGLGFDYQLPNNFSAFFNAYSDVITDVPSGFQSFFNTPKYRVNAGFANSGLGKSKHFGFNAMLHWQDAFMWDGELANGPVNAFTTLDAQVSYNLPKIKSMIKLGGSNIFNHYYKNAYANPEVGGVYYVSFGYHL
ncbi:MAG: TonB-dependent receptor [Acidobacteria bacterium]|nr:MAG: TonB-dependent receptor [Acidobacteriota bacterium]